MLTSERHQRIMDLIKQKQTVTIQDVAVVTGASESTIRRDLTELENRQKLRRIHGGATIHKQISSESSVGEKSAKNNQEKTAIAKHAASLVAEGDCIFLDAGTTTTKMIPYLQGKQVTVVTNGLTHMDSLEENGIPTYLTGGYMKSKTGALIGTQTMETLGNYRFDACFIGVNGFDITYGYTTPDPEEAGVKRTALRLARGKYVLADSSKYQGITFAGIAALDAACLITTLTDEHMLTALRKQTEVRSVSP
ncbi:DeoR/GlpR transcriptional regulator [Lentibacillus cibarius]|uniref:DeoR/GlpR transcriptional regulator n=1 Tax=Lentibacillus cibarius TaxID=2583219 RepID=A0A549YJF4_9BACI|nr:DeoR/GlpR family DNA-binding transcription regulator [Lentibacillus cibarius]TMN23209.1 DeoR/GlpR transcriptional regulator [Lentibacillus cibarius]TRM11994.1 DeoR/GlpR transcriptional regulator [Lentibacillus cibarius]